MGLGCVLHFCVEARPRFSSKDEETSRALILAFDGSAGNFRRQLGFGHSAIMNLGFVLFRYAITVRLVLHGEEGYGEQ